MPDDLERPPLRRRARACLPAILIDASADLFSTAASSLPLHLCRFITAADVAARVRGFHLCASA